MRRCGHLTSAGRRSFEVVRLRILACSTLEKQLYEYLEVYRAMLPESSHANEGRHPARQRRARTTKVRYSSRGSRTPAVTRPATPWSCMAPRRSGRSVELVELG